MCEKCPIDQRYPYYGFPVTPDSRKLRDEAERYREIAIRCFVAESDCADVKRADALWRVVCYVRARSFVCDHSHSHGHCMRSRPYLSCSRRDCGRRGDHVVASWLWLWHRVSAVASWP